MPGLELLDVAISLVFLYLLLSLLCSALAEFVEALMKRRSVVLLGGIKEMLNDPDGKVLVDKLYRQTFIFSLFKGDYDPNNPNARNLPSYIPTGNFVAALLGVLVPDSQGVGEIDKLKEAIGKIADEKVRTALTDVVNTSNNDIEKLKTNIGAWYESSMGRVSGWYKRYAQFVTLALGFALAVLFNADTIGVSGSLTHDRAVRAAYVAVAQGYAERQPGSDTPRSFNQLFSEVQDAPVELGLPLGWNERTVPGGVPGWLLKILGWFLTAAATSLGASFWFDLLKNLVNIRSTLKPEAQKPASGQA